MKQVIHGAEGANHTPEVRVAEKGEQIMNAPPSTSVISAEGYATLKLARDFGVIILPLAYASGFIVLQVYLGRIGVVSLGFLNAQYLVAGTLFLCSVCLVWVPIGAGKLIVFGLRPISVNMSIYSFTVGAGWFLASRVFDYVGVEVHDTIWWMSIAGIPLLILMGTTWRKIRMVSTGPIILRTALIGFVPFLLVWVGLASTFATSLYPKIDRGFGGARPVKFELMITGDHSPASGVYNVLAVTDRYWIVQDSAAGTYMLLSSDRVKTAILKEPIGSRPQSH